MDGLELWSQWWSGYLEDEQSFFAQARADLDEAKVIVLTFEGVQS